MAKKFIQLTKQVEELKDLKDTFRAIEKISAGYLHFLRQRTQALNKYAETLITFSSLLNYQHFKSPFLIRRQGRKLIFIITSNKGNCGGLFHKLIDFSINEITWKDEVAVYGNRGRRLLKEKGIKVNYYFEGEEIIFQKERFEKIKEFLTDKYLKKQISEIAIVYPKFVHLTKFRPTVFKFLPIQRSELIEVLQPIESREVIYEPSYAQVVEYFLKEYLEVELLSKFFETRLCELLARTIFMEEAQEKIDCITKKLIHNALKLRKLEITKNLTDLYSKIYG